MSGDGPDWLGKMLLTGKYGAEFLPVAVDENGQLYIVIQGIPEVTIPDAVDVTQTDSVREVQGADGATRRTLAVDSSGQLIMVPRGATGNYMAVDADGYLTALTRGVYSVLGDQFFDNPGFETAGGGGGDIFANWTEDTVGASTVNDETSDVYAGSHSCRLDIDASNNIAQVRQTKAVIAGEVYRVGCAYKTTGTAYGLIEVYDKTHSAMIDLMYLPPTSTWTVVGKDYTMPAGCISVQVTYKRSNAASQSIYFDDCSIRWVAESLKVPLSTDEAGQIVMVPRGQDGYYMHVDSEGNLSAMLKALYGSTPTGVACDDGGRVKFILCDNVDQWGQYLEVGNAELAARLKRLPLSYDRRGQVLFWDDFRDGQGAWQFTTGGSGAGSIVTSGWLQGGKCIQLALTAADADTALAQMFLPCVPATVGVGVGFFFSFSALPESFQFGLNYGNGTTLHTAEVILDRASGEIWANTVALGWTAVGTWGTAVVGNQYWHQLKLAFSRSTGEYLYLLYDGQEIDLSAHSVPSAASSYRQIWPDLYVQGRAATAVTVYVDCVTITTKES